MEKKERRRRGFNQTGKSNIKPPAHPREVYGVGYTNRLEDKKSDEKSLKLDREYLTYNVVVVFMRFDPYHCVEDPVGVAGKKLARAERIGR
jgi:hypothetical protein